VDGAYLIITIEPGKRSGKPCIRGMRITVQDVFEYLAGGMTEDQILEDFPELTREDINACFAFAAAGLNKSLRPHHDLRSSRTTSGLLASRTFVDRELKATLGNNR
jgi:uncharacterized protein (DUF433 family)